MYKIKKKNQKIVLDILALMLHPFISTPPPNNSQLFTTAAFLRPQGGRFGDDLTVPYSTYLILRVPFISQFSRL